MAFSWSERLNYSNIKNRGIGGGWYYWWSFSSNRRNHLL